MNPAMSKAKLDRNDFIVSPDFFSTLLAVIFIVLVIRYFFLIVVHWAISF